MAELPLNLQKLLACLPQQSAIPSAVNIQSIAGENQSSRREWPAIRWCLVAARRRMIDGRL